MALKIQSKRFGRNLILTKASHFLLAITVAANGILFVLPSIIANAAPDTTYTARNFSDLGLTTDRQAPSGGKAIGTTTLSEGVVGAGATNGFYQWEGLQGHITTSNSVEAKLYVDPSWAGKTVTAGMWGVTQSSKAADGNAWPIIAYTNKGGTGHFEMYDTMVTGDWTALSGTVTSGTSYTLEIAYNSLNKTYDFYVNNVKEGSETAVDSTGTGDTFDHFTGVIFDNYNTAVAGNDYTVQWSDFATGFAAPNGLQMLDNTLNNYAPLAAGVVSNKSNPKQFDLTWNAVPGTTHYVTSTYLNGNPVGNSGWTGTPNSWVYNDGFAQYGDGSYTFKVCAYNTDGTEACTMSGAYIYDTTAPVVSVTPVAGSFIHGQQAFTITVTDNNLNSAASNVWVYLYNNGGTQKSQGAKVNLSSGHGTFTADTTKLDDGLSTLDVGRFADAAGNLTGTGDTYFKNYVVDNTIPTATINNTTPTSLYGSTINVHAIDTNYQQTDLYKVGDTTPFKTYTGEYFGLFWLSDGNYRMVVRDKAGNSKEYDFTIDKNPPTVPTNGAPNNTYENTNNFWFTWNGSIDNSGQPVTYELIASQNQSALQNAVTTGDVSSVWDSVRDGAGSGQYPLNSPTDHSTGAGDGTWYWAVRAIDTAGNRSGWSNVWNVNIDTSAPDVTLNDYSANNNVITPNLTATDANSPLTYLWTPADTASASNVTISDPTIAAPTFTASSDGTYNFNLKTTDPAGNVTNKTFSFTYTAPGTPAVATSTPSVTFTNLTSTPGATGGNFTNVAFATAPTPATSNDSAVLGAQTQKPNASNDEAVLGTTATPKKGTNGQWNILGLTWYWWLPIIVVLGGGAWWLLAATRRRGES